MASQLFADFNGRQRQTLVNMGWLVIEEWGFGELKVIPLVNQDLPVAHPSPTPSLAHRHHPRSHIDHPRTSVPLTLGPNPDEHHDRCVSIPRITGAATNV